MKYRAVVKFVLPDRVWHALRGAWRRYRERRYRSQRFVFVRCGDFVLEAPETHGLVQLLKTQPYRDLCVGIAARSIARKYPDATFVDVGANIGDTAAIMASHARSNRLILVEGSDYFFEFLERNAQLLPNPVTLIKALISDGRDTAGAFHHWAGTASFVESAGPVRTTRTLADVADAQTRFVKTDTDGFDFKILRNSIEWLGTQKPAVLFEDQIRTPDDLVDANDLLVRLTSIGFTHFVVWDDPGFHMVSTSDFHVIEDLHRYLFNVWQHSRHKSISNYDVLCLHHDDADVFEDIKHMRYQAYVKDS
jgi:FkbM family methyltransferase